jgi:hypothetical protein
MVDASSDESFLESWSQLTGSLGRGAQLLAAYGVAR